MEIIKASGEREPFDREKFCRSLQRAEAPKDIVDRVCGIVEKQVRSGMSTEELSRKAAQQLAKEDFLLAAKFNLRNAIMELGPAGFLFEEYVAAVLEEYGYTTRVGQMVKGKCVSHEIDIVAERDNEHYLIEAKYHNRRGLKSDVQVAMYMYARFLDIKQVHEEYESLEMKHQAWLITNTKFTSNATRYAECMGLKMTGWGYPGKESLENLIIKKALYPVTVLPTMNQFVREQFAKERLFFVRDLLTYSSEDLVKKFGLYSKTAKKLMTEAYSLV